MEQIGYVIESKNGVAKVRVDRESACGGKCVSCNGCPTKAIIVETKDEYGLKRGDVVNLFEDSRKVIRYALIGYGLMAVLMVLGAVIGFMTTGKDFSALLFAAGFLSAGFLFVKLVFRKVESTFIIKEVVSQQESMEKDVHI